jgi:hypothetical protein
MADFYVRAARALQDVLAHRGSIKGISAGSGTVNDAKRVMALVVNTLSFREALQHALEQVDLARREPKWFGSASLLHRERGPTKKDTRKELAADETRAPSLAECVALVLAHDLLLARGIQAARAWPPRERMERYKSQLHAALVRLQIRRGKTSVEELRAGAAERRIAARIPRWVRINTVQTDEASTLAQLAALGWCLVDGDVITDECVLALFGSLAESRCCVRGTSPMYWPFIRARPRGS